MNIYSTLSYYVYVICSDEGLYKIGYSKNPTERMRQLQVSIPHKLTLIHDIMTTQPKLLEKQLHEAYSHKHVRGEWFALSEYDIIEIKDM